MNKRQFLASLDKKLSKLNNEERRRQLDYYEEMINDRIDEGLSEEAAVERMGTVQGVAAKILSEATPEQMAKKKKIGVLGWIGIALGALILTVAALVALYVIDRAEDSLDVDIDDIIEERMGLDDGWILGGSDAEINASEVGSVDIVWSCGGVTVDETEGRSIVIKAGDSDALEYQIKDGVLYIETVENYAGKANLKVLIPEDIMQMDKLNIVTTDGDVRIDGEYFTNINVAAAGGTVRLNPEDASNVSIASAGGDIIVELDEDDAFVMNYAADGGDVSVGFDRGFVNESGSGKSASYDHSFGRANCLSLEISVSGADIKLIDD